MYALISGGLDVMDHAMEEDPVADPSAGKLLSRLQAGDVLGEMGLLRGVPRSATLIATRPCELLRINLKMIRRLQWLYPPTAHKFFFNLMTILCDRLERASTCLFENSLTDDVTGLWNRKSFLTSLDCESHRSSRYDSALSLCLLRIDSPQGPTRSCSEMADDALQLCSRTLRGHLRRSDILGRLGTATFALLLPHTKVGDARRIGERMACLLRAGLRENGGDGLEVALGLAGIQGRRDHQRDLYAAAASALESGGGSG